MPTKKPRLKDLQDVRNRCLIAEISELTAKRNFIYKLLFVVGVRLIAFLTANLLSFRIQKHEEGLPYTRCITMLLVLSIIGAYQQHNTCGALAQHVRSMYT